MPYGGPGPPDPLISNTEPGYNLQYGPYGLSITHMDVFKVDALI